MNPCLFCQDGTLPLPVGPRAWRDFRGLRRCRVRKEPVLLPLSTTARHLRVSHAWPQPAKSFCEPYHILQHYFDPAWKCVVSGIAVALGKVKGSWELRGHDLPSCPECQPEPGVFIITGRRTPVPGYLILWRYVRWWGRQGKKLYFRARRQKRKSGRVEGWAMELWVLDGAVYEQGARKPAWNVYEMALWLITTLINYKMNHN